MAELSNKPSRAWVKLTAPYQNPDVRRSLAQLADSFVPYVLLWAAMAWTFKVGLWPLTLVLAVPAAGMLVRLFIVFHDCTHSSFFKDQKLPPEANSAVNGLVASETWQALATDQRFAAASELVNGISEHIPVNASIKHIFWTGKWDAIVGNLSLFKTALRLDLLHLGFGEVFEDDPFSFVWIAAEAEHEQVHFIALIERPAEFIKRWLSQQVVAAASADHPVTTGIAMKTTLADIILILITRQRDESRSLIVVDVCLLPLPKAGITILEVVVDSIVNIPQELLLVLRAAPEMV